MATLQPAPASVSAPPRRWPLFLIGVLLVFLGPAILYVVQFRMYHLKTPWYVPILASVGVLLMAVSVWQRRGIWRSVGLVLAVVVCGFEWYGLLVAFKLPSYAGPAKPEHKIPAFTTALAKKGESFTNKDLATGKRTVLVFFRGRW
jgi:hypothetical protein